MKILLNVWILNWPLVPYHSSNRYPCARLTRPSCIRGSNRSADVCRVAHVCRGWRISTKSVNVWIWPPHATYRDVYNVCYVQKHFCPGFYVTSMDTAMALAQKVWKKSDGQ